MPAVPTKASKELPSVRAFVGLGANLGDARAAVESAAALLGTLSRTTLVAVSPLYRSAPVDAMGPDFVNAAAEVRTALAPHALLHALQRIEQGHGRERPYVNAPRTLDLDLLMYGTLSLHDAELTLPHPRMHLRAFVLAPLAQLAPGLVVPGHGRVEQLLADVSDQPVELIAT
jgi:2-amino-4-hydroxy-6-hydroxymethyldihydropteridine diphosphokinase